MIQCETRPKLRHWGENRGSSPAANAHQACMLAALRHLCRCRLESQDGQRGVFAGSGFISKISLEKLKSVGAAPVINQAVDGTDAVVVRLQPFDIVCVMRERTPMTRAIIERL